MLRTKNTVLVVAGLVQSKQQPDLVLLVRRGPEMSGAGFWEFPGGKVESGELEKVALQRELLEELSVHTSVGAFVGENLHHYPDKKILLRLYWTLIEEGELLLTEHDAHKWVSIAEIQVLELSPADRPFLAMLGN